MTKISEQPTIHTSRIHTTPTQLQYITPSTQHPYIPPIHTTHTQHPYITPSTQHPYIPLIHTTHTQYPYTVPIHTRSTQTIHTQDPYTLPHHTHFLGNCEHLEQHCSTKLNLKLLEKLVCFLNLLEQRTVQKQITFLITVTTLLKISVLQPEILVRIFLVLVGLCTVLFLAPPKLRRHLGKKGNQIQHGFLGRIVQWKGFITEPDLGILNQG